MTPSADIMSYVNHPKFYEIYKGDFTAVPMEKKKIFAHFSFFSRLALVVGSLYSQKMERLPQRYSPLA
jgi:hypothetical protein